MVYSCEFVTFPLVSWVRCGTWPLFHQSVTRWFRPIRLSAGDRRLPMSAKLTGKYIIFHKNSIHVPSTTTCIYVSKNAYVFWDHVLYSFIIFVHLSYYLYFVYRILRMSVSIDGCTRSWEGLEFRLAADTPTRYYNTGINPKWVMG